MDKRMKTTLTTDSNKSATLNVTLLGDKGLIHEIVSRITVNIKFTSDGPQLFLIQVGEPVEIHVDKDALVKLIADKLEGAE